MKTATQPTNHNADLDSWLERAEADESWSEKIEGTGATVTGYLINSRLVVVVRYAENLGWELMVAGSYQNSTEATLNGAAKALGIVVPKKANSDDPEDPNSHAYAARKAKYSHKCWIVWYDEEGVRHAAAANAASLERAIKETNGRKFWGYSSSTGQGNILNPGVADAWLSNAQARTLN